MKYKKLILETIIRNEGFLNYKEILKMHEKNMCEQLAKEIYKLLKEESNLISEKKEYIDSKESYKFTLEIHLKEMEKNKNGD